MIRPTSRMSSSSKPRMVTAGVPSRTPEATVGGRSSNGTVLRLTVIATSSQALLRVLAGPRAATQVELEQMRVGAAREQVEPAVEQSSGERVGVRTDLRLVGAERIRGRDLEARRLGGDRVLERASLHSREHRSVERRRVLLPAEHEAAAGPGERLVRRRGDEVAVRRRVRVQPRGDEAGEMGHVAEEQRARPRRRRPGSARPRSPGDTPRRRRRSSFGRCSFASRSTSSKSIRPVSRSTP